MRRRDAPRVLQLLLGAVVLLGDALPAQRLAPSPRAPARRAIPPRGLAFLPSDRDHEIPEHAWYANAFADEYGELGAYSPPAWRALGALARGLGRAAPRALALASVVAHAVQAVRLRRAQRAAAEAAASKAETAATLEQVDADRSVLRTEARMAGAQRDEAEARAHDAEHARRALASRVRERLERAVADGAARADAASEERAAARAREADERLKAATERAAAAHEAELASVRAQMAGVLARAQGVLQRKLVDAQNETRQELLRQHEGLAGLFDGDSDGGDADGDGASDVGAPDDDDDDDDVRFHDEADEPADDDEIDESPLRMVE